jgi:hypothetical protein
MGFRFWWRAERWHTQSGPEARAPVEGVDDFVNGPGTPLPANNSSLAPLRLGVPSERSPISSLVRTSR